MRTRYLSSLHNWLSSIEPYLGGSPFDAQHLVYGTGYDSWGVQTQQKAFASFAVCAKLSRNPQAYLDRAIALLRFNLDSHKSGRFACTDGKKWGHTWISALGIERMMPALQAIYEELPAALQAQLRVMLISEADWLLHKHVIVASAVDASKNKPESNLWNGALLHRVAMMYADAENAEAYREKGTRYLLNSISVPSDRDCQKVFAGKTVAAWHIDANFQPSYGLVHHGYLNVGYMLICLSQIALLHFSCKAAGKKAPEELYWHCEELWALVRKLCAPDGRLLRIGGDTRVRYCYCQDYALLAWLLMAEKYEDQESRQFEAGWLELLLKEQRHNADGSYLGTRLAQLKERSPLYYTRLESDRALCLALAALWQDYLPQPEAEDEEAETGQYAWHDDFHGAAFLRQAGTLRSFVWRAAQSPVALCLPLADSSLAEWGYNCASQILGTGQTHSYRLLENQVRDFPGGFMSMGKFETVSEKQLAEGQSDEIIAQTQIACIALPDQKSMLFMQYAQTLQRVYIKYIRGLMLQLPNDLFNDWQRHIYSPGQSRLFKGMQPPYGTIDLQSKLINIDGRLNVELLYGADTLLLERGRQRQVYMKNKEAAGGNLYCEHICSKYSDRLQCFEGAALLLDEGFAIQAGAMPVNKPATIQLQDECSPACRLAAFRAADQVLYAMSANFSEQTGRIKLKPNVRLTENGEKLPGDTIVMKAGTCRLFIVTEA
ncbi:MAG: hypothetical protein PHG44_01855 [Lentisphaeria bacterium]|nr:hypothetical protein [Lentisphaeria bacterium]